MTHRLGKHQWIFFHFSKTRIINWKESENGLQSLEYSPIENGLPSLE